ncbi:MAG: hypothetical protein KF878_34750, partial [Planctomycetes bacterium]|nr:hypothetical protein [Planctomycetota bacterium]
ARAAADAPLLEALAARARAGRLELEALLPLGPEAVDAVLARLGDGFSLRLQNGLRQLALGLAGAPASADRDRLLAVALGRLRPHVAADRAFRADVARGLRARLGAEVADGLERVIDGFEKDGRP